MAFPSGGTLGCWAGVLVPRGVLEVGFLGGVLLLGCSKPPSSDAGGKVMPSAAAPGPQAPTAGPGSSAAGGELRVEKPAGESPRVGDPAPEFSAVAHNGQAVSLRALRGRAVILYFYPKDGTPGCTVEAEQFRSHHASLEDAGAVVIGVSADDNESHREFAQELGLPFLLVPDESRALARSYGVGGFLGMSKRVTYLIDREGRIAKVYPEVDPKNHAQELLEDLGRLSSK